MTGLFDEVLMNGHYTAESGIELSYEEESYIESISNSSIDLSSFVTEGLIEITSVSGSLLVMEGLASQEISKGANVQSVQESLADRAQDAYDTIKRWATKIWKAIKKFAQKVWNRLKAIRDKVVGYFTNYTDTLRNYKGNVTIDWVKMDILALAQKVNSDYDAEIKAQAGTPANGSNPAVAPASTNAGKVVEEVLKTWRNTLYKDKAGTGNVTDGRPIHGTSTWNAEKGEILRVTELNPDKLVKTFLNMGEKDFREAMSLDKERIEDRESRYDDIEAPDYEEGKANENKFNKYIANREAARSKILWARVRLQLRQHGINMINKAVGDHYRQCVAAARKVINAMHNIKESYDYSGDYNMSVISSMI